MGHDSEMLSGQVATLVFFCGTGEANLHREDTGGKEQVVKILKSSLSPKSPWKRLGVEKTFVCFSSVGASCIKLSANWGSWIQSKSWEVNSQLERE